MFVWALRATAERLLTGQCSLDACRCEFDAIMNGEGWVGEVARVASRYHDVTLGAFAGDLGDEVMNGQVVHDAVDDFLEAVEEGE